MKPACLWLTAADAGFFPLLQGTISSIRDNPRGAAAVIAVLDLGLTQPQLHWLHGKVNLVRTVECPWSFPGGNDAPAYLKALLARPFLPELLPGFNVYLWIDADAWVQEWQAIDWLINGAERRGLAIVPEIDVGFLSAAGESPFVEFAFKHYEAAFNRDIATQLHRLPMLNCGVFALRHDAPHWQAWAERLRLGLQNGANLVTDQLALNVAVYLDGLLLQTELLPAWCNWVCHRRPPAWDQIGQRFVEPYPPHLPLGIVHLTGHTKHQPVHLRALSGNDVDMSLQYRRSRPA